MKVLPALLNSTIEEFASQFNTLLPYFDRFSIDIQDGVYVPTKTINTNSIVEYFRTNLPAKPIVLDFDLMTYNYKQCIEDLEELAEFVKVGNVVVQNKLLKDSVLPSSTNFAIGISLNPEDQIETIAREHNLNTIPCLQIMSIYAGPQGQPFIPEMLNKIDRLKALNYRSSIYIDGSINSQTLPVILDRSSKPDYLCVGSFLSKAKEDLIQRIEYLQSIEKQ